MAQLVVVPELVHDLLFLHVGGKLFLLNTGGEPLKLVYLGVALLGVLLGLCALALKLQLAETDAGYLVLNGLYLSGKCPALGLFFGYAGVEALSGAPPR